MMNLLKQFVTLLMICMLFSCEQNDCCVNPEGGSNTLTGTWLLFERGYSPGGGYITEPVSANPAQTITFRNNGEMISTISGSDEYKFYFIQGSIIAFYKEYPGSSPELATFTTSFDLSFVGDNIKLQYRYCIEGCHMQLRKID